MICIIGSDSTKNYGLFDDLKDDKNINLVYTEKLPFYNLFIRRVLRKVGFKNITTTTYRMSWESNILSNAKRHQHIVVIDTALRKLSLEILYKCKEANPCLKITCLLLNSTGSFAMSDSSITSKIKSFPWDTISTFDPEDAKTNGWTYFGFQYYSKHSVSHSSVKYDAFYAGTIKGERGEKVLDLLRFFNSNGVSAHFICPQNSKYRKATELPSGIDLIHKRISYKDVLQHTVKANCIIEFVKEGQAGPSLRYFEAVCYNKKLLTVNPHIKEFPYYDERYMRVFAEPNDIDLDWLKEHEDIDYGYTDEFSPKHWIKCLCEGS